MLESRQGRGSSADDEWACPVGRERGKAGAAAPVSRGARTPWLIPNGRRYAAARGVNNGEPFLHAAWIGAGALVAGETVTRMHESVLDAHGRAIHV